MNRKNRKNNSAIDIIVITIFTILPLIGIYITPKIWWKAFFLLILLGILQKNIFQQNLTRLFLAVHSAYQLFRKLEQVVLHNQFAFINIF